MPTPGGQSNLEKAAIAARNLILPKNTYNSASPQNGYNATHTRAVADTTTPIQGKGTGNYLDINNYGAGGDLDINGVPSIPGSGRKSALIQNAATWGYAPVSPYQAPDTKGNIGQVII